MQVFIECERGSRIKRNCGPDLKLERQSEVLLPYPYPYGFIPGTAADDGDGVDCYLLTEESVPFGRIVQAEPVGLLPMTEDEERDFKVVAVLPGHSPEEFPGAEEEIRSFILGIFRKFPEVRVSVGGMLGRDAAREYIAERAAAAGEES